MFLSHVHNFRALAIIFIVAGHSIYVFNWRNNLNTKYFLQDIFQNGTVLFVFIAGYLFLYLARNFSYGAYLRKKLAYVILPYVLISIPAVLYAFYGQDLEEIYPQLVGHSTGWKTLWLYLKGGAHINYTLWFVPMIAVFYMCAPLFIAVREHPSAYWSILPLFGFALLLHRSPFPVPELWHMFIYFLPIYLLGMFACQYRDIIDPLIARSLWPLGLVVLTIFTLQCLVFNHHGGYTAHYIFDFNQGIFDWLLLQKTLCCFFLLGLLRHYDRLMPAWLGLIGTTSFTIFFLHVYVLLLYARFLSSEGRLGDFWSWSLATCGALLGSAAIALVARRIMPRYSRMLLGS
jgi:hypothetical protein